MVLTACNSIGNRADNIANQKPSTTLTPCSASLVDASGTQVDLITVTSEYLSMSSVSVGDNHEIAVDLDIHEISKLDQNPVRDHFLDVRLRDNTLLSGDPNEALHGITAIGNYSIFWNDIRNIDF